MNTIGVWDCYSVKAQTYKTAVEVRWISDDFINNKTEPMFFFCKLISPFYIKHFTELKKSLLVLVFFPSKGGHS